MKKDTYTIEVHCGNCGYGYPYDDEMEIQKGIKEKDWSKNTPCPRCECVNTLYFHGRAYSTYSTQKNLTQK